MSFEPTTEKPKQGKKKANQVLVQVAVFLTSSQLEKVHLVGIQIFFVAMMDCKV